MFNNLDDYTYLNTWGFFAEIGIFIILLGLVLLILGIVAKWRIFKKAGKKGWEAIIPFYSDYVLVEIAGLNWWWFFFLILDLTLTFDNSNISLDIISFIGKLNCYYNIAKRFGKDKNTSIFAGIFNYIFMLIFGFSKNEVYNKNIVVNPNGIFGNTQENCERTTSTRDVDKEESNYKKSETSTGNVDKENNTKEVSTSSDSDTSYCSECGCELIKDMKFCPNCGKDNK